MVNKGNRRGEGNRGLVHYYQDGDGDGNGNGNCLREKGVEQGGERGNGRMGIFLFIVFIFDGGEEHCFMLILLLFFLSLPFQCRSTDFASSLSQLLDNYLLQDFSSSPNLVITFLFGNKV